MKDRIRGLFQQAAANVARAGDGAYIDGVVRSVELLDTAFRTGRKLLVFGNGGSAADAQHLAAELVGRFARDRRALPAIALTSNQALLTAWSNDRSFESVFARQIEALGEPGDVAWAITTSGRSPNVVSALRRAQELKLRTIALTGEGGAHLENLCDVLLAVPVANTAQAQEVHVVTYHAVCDALENRLLKS